MFEERLSTSPGQPELLRLVGLLGAVARELVEVADARAWALPAVDRARAVEALVVARRSADAAHLSLVRSLTDADARDLGASGVAALLSWRLRLPHGRARADVAAAAATDPDGGDLPVVGAALAAGEVSAEHVAVAVRTLDRLPSQVRRQHAAGVDAFLAEQSRVFRPGEVEHLAARVLDRVDPDRCERGFDPAAFARRHLSIRADGTGMVLVRGQLDPAAGAQLVAAVEHHAAPTPATDAPRADGQGSVRVRDDRTPGQRRADALGVLARQGLTATGTRGGQPPRVVVHATTAQLTGVPGAGRAVCEQTGPVSAAVLARLAADATLQAVLLAPSGAVLRLGRAVRCITTAQRTALLARDGGCVVPGCDAPSAQLEGHHVTAWAAGGRTDVDDLVLACGPHHTMAGLGIWHVRMVDGVPQIRAPAWVDPDQVWLTNPRRRADLAVDTLQLTLDTAAVQVIQDGAAWPHAEGEDPSARGRLPPARDEPPDVDGPDDG